MYINVIQTTPGTRHFRALGFNKQYTITKCPPEDEHLPTIKITQLIRAIDIHINVTGTLLFLWDDSCAKFPFYVKSALNLIEFHTRTGKDVGIFAAENFKDPSTPHIIGFIVESNALAPFKKTLMELKDVTAADFDNRIFRMTPINYDRGIYEIHNDQGESSTDESSIGSVWKYLVVVAVVGTLAMLVLKR